MPPKPVAPGAPIDDKEHEFWKTQPVPQTTATADELKKASSKLTAKDFNGTPLETKTVADVPKEPYPVASILEWFTPDVTTPNLSLG